MALGTLAAAAAVVFGIASAPPTPATVAVAAEVGLTPESLVVAGAAAEDGATALSRIAAVPEAVAEVAAAQALLDGRCAELAVADAGLAAHPGDAAALAAQSAAASAVDSARAALDASRAALRSIALGEAPSGVEPALAVYLGSTAVAVPPEFRAASRTPEQWSAIESALRAEARAARLGAAPEANQAALLAAARSEPAVAQAKARLEAGLAAMAQAFAPAG